MPQCAILRITFLVSQTTLLNIRTALHSMPASLPETLYCKYVYVPSLGYLRNSISKKFNSFMPNVHHVTRRNLNILATIQASKRNDRQLKFATPPPYFPYFFFFRYFFLLTPSAYLHLHTSFVKLKYVWSYIVYSKENVFSSLNVRRKWST